MFQRRTLPLFLSTFVLMTGYGSIFTLLAVIREEFGLSEAEVGVVGAAGFLAGFVAQIGLARFADRGRTRLLLQLGLLCAIAGNVGMIFAADFWGLVAARVLLGLGGGAFSPAVRRLVIAADPARAGERLGLLASFDMAGLIAGPVLASILYQGFGLDATFLALAGMLAVLVLPVLRVPFEESPPRDATGSPLAALLSLRAIRGVLLCSLAFYITIGVFEAIWAVFLDDLGASQTYIGATISVFSLPMLILPAFAGRFAGRVGPLRVVALSVGCAIPCMALYAVVTDLVGLALLVFLHAIFDACTMPSLQLGIARASPAEHLASGQGLVGGAGQLTAAATALASGWIYGLWGAEALFFGSAGLMAVLLVLGLWQGVSLMSPAEPPSA